MKKFDEVEQAKALMTEGLSWSVMKWIAEKKACTKGSRQGKQPALDNPKNAKRFLE